jgi:hypothetical protein
MILSRISDFVFPTPHLSSNLYTLILPPSYTSSILLSVSTHLSIHAHSLRCNPWTSTTSTNPPIPQYPPVSRQPSLHPAPNYQACLSHPASFIQDHQPSTSLQPASSPQLPSSSDAGKESNAKDHHPRD